MPAGQIYPYYYTMNFTSLNKHFLGYYGLFPTSYTTTSRAFALTPPIFELRLHFDFNYTPESLVTPNWTAA